MGKTYIRVQLVDLLDGRLYIARMNGVAYRDSCTDCLFLGFLLDVCFHCKLAGRVWVTLFDEVVHDDGVDVAVREKS